MFNDDLGHVIPGRADGCHTSVDVSIEQVAKLAEQNTLPEPSLDLSQLHAAPSTFTFNRQTSNPVLRAPAPPYSSDDPWSAPSRIAAGGGGTSTTNDTTEQTALTNGAPSNVAGSGLPREWWKRQEKVAVNFGGLQGFILNRYMVYDVVTEVRSFILRTMSLMTLILRLRSSEEPLLLDATRNSYFSSIVSCEHWHAVMWPKLIVCCVDRSCPPVSFPDNTTTTSQTDRT